MLAARALVVFACAAPSALAAPLLRATSPVARAASPVARAASPVARAASPVARAGTPAARAGTPAARAGTPASAAAASTVSWIAASDTHFGHDPVPKNASAPIVTSLTKNLAAVAEMNRLVAGTAANGTWPAALGGGAVLPPQFLTISGDLIDDGGGAGREVNGCNQWSNFTSVYGDVPNVNAGAWRGLTYEGRGNHDGGNTSNALPAECASVPSRSVAARNAARAADPAYAIDAVSAPTGLHYSWTVPLGPACKLHFVHLNLFPGHACGSPANPNREGLAPGGFPCTDGWSWPEDSMGFLETDLAAHAATRDVLVSVIFHYGLDGWSRTWFNSDQAAELISTLLRYNTLAVWVGHTHGAAVYSFNGTDLGAWGDSRPGFLPVVNAPATQKEDGDHNPLPSEFMVAEAAVTGATSGRFRVAQRVGSAWGDVQGSLPFQCAALSLPPGAARARLSAPPLLFCASSLESRRLSGAPAPVPAGAPGGAPPGAPASAAPTTSHFSKVVVHPLVLLSVTDHYARTAKDSKTKRAVGVLLGESFAGRLDVVNSFALPFEEDAKDGGIFFLDADYLEAMFTMFKKIAAKERVVGFYSTGPKIRAADARLEELFRKYTPRPVLLVVDVRPETDGLPTQAYMAVEAVTDGAAPVRSFAHVPSEVGAYEAEEVGVEHLLRDINDPSVSALGADVRAKVAGVRGLLARLDDVAAYLAAVRAGALPANRDILYDAQRVLSLLPDAGAEPARRALVEGANDAHLAVYVAAAARAVTALHDVVTNKALFKEGETPEEAAARLKAEKDAADKAAADRKKADAEAEKERKQRAKFGGTGKEPKE